MKSERWVFGGLALFYALMAVIYWFTTHEVVGVWVLGLSAAMGLMVYFYVRVLSRRIDPRPSDDKEAEVIDGAGVIGFFPPKSIWPFWCSVTIAVMCLGVVFGWWLTVLGMGIGIWAVSGWCFEFYRGDYAH
ncbi:cytochrome c oxidase subunit 4 [Acidipropionibacterium timonense]|uniref:cytochrome c oxidase subunit 4 n=1 Tax=Acidipropionibacterium timonense TaxID=2161818 RepID=UPI00102FC932|nr:cytochrome c oxidase subunit 4 [Acidipropionibacterium timonense]